MATVVEPAVLDEKKLMDFVFKAVDEVGATLNAALVVMGDKLGYYRALAHAARSRRPSSLRAPERPSGTCGNG